MTAMHAVATNSVSWTPIAISVGSDAVVGAVSAVIVASYCRLQSHRADAVAMANYRKLAEEAVANQQELRDQLAKLTEKVQAVEQLMREVG